MTTDGFVTRSNRGLHHFKNGTQGWNRTNIISVCKTDAIPLGDSRIGATTTT